jgi:aminocarboxymuconate-semialdehyde decarboxylase
LATIPPQDADAACETIDAGVRKLGLRGVCLHSNVAGECIAAPNFQPIYARLNDLGAPLVLHPTRSVAADTLERFGREMDIGLGWMFDTSAAALSLIFSGILDEFPRVTVLHPHAGGVLPYIANRLEATAAMRGDWRAGKRSLYEYFRTRFYTDSVSGNASAVALARELYGSDRLLFASDSPWASCSQAVAFARENLTARDGSALFTNRLPLANTQASGGRAESKV